jgi:hypothetical protein
VAIKVLLCYAYQNEGMVKRLKNHLSSLEHHEDIILQDYGNIPPGAEWEEEMSKYFEEAQIILLVISDAFLASRYYCKTGIQQAIQRHEHKNARVIPIILRPVLWEKPPIDKLQPLPDAARPVSKWRSLDDGFMNVALGIQRVVEQWNTKSLPGPLAEREAIMTDLDQLITTVKAQMQLPVRANAVAGTLQQLSIFIPNEVTLADLIVGWRILAQSSQNAEDAATTQRRVTCGELADMAARITQEQGSLARAIQTWQSWQEAFANSNDPRQFAMAKTFARELSELQASSH